MIEALAIAIALAGIAMLCVLYTRIRSVDRQSRLDKHRSTDAGLADLLNYAAMVDDGVIVGKNGSFIAAWLYKGDDNASSTDEQREMVSFRINQALSSMGSGWMVHVDAVRQQFQIQNQVRRGTDQGRIKRLPGLVWLGEAVEHERHQMVPVVER